MNKNAVMIELNLVEKAKEFNKLLMKYDSDFILSSGSYSIDATSLLGIFSLDLSKPVELNIIEKKDGEKEKVLKEIRNLGINILD